MNILEWSNMGILEWVLCGMDLKGKSIIDLINKYF